MEKNTIITTAPVETNESQLPNRTDDNCQDFYQSDYENPTPFWKRTISWHSVIIVMLTLSLIMSAIQVHQYREYGKALEREAYVISVSINLMEDTLMFKYGVLPEDIGFEELRSTWIDNPCHETSMAYYNALQYALDYFEHGNSPIETFNPIKV